MRRRVRVVAAAFAAATAVFVAALIAGCHSGPTVREIFESLPVKQVEFYNFDPASPLADRIVDAPAELLDLYEEAEGGVRPLVYTPNDEERQQIVDALEMLPVRHQEVIRERLVAVYCIDRFAGTGMADIVLGPDDEFYALLILHKRVFTDSATDLLEYRESSAFSDTSDEICLEIDLPEWVSLLRYITLHEVSHIVDYVDQYTPYVEPASLALAGRSERDTTFTDEVWSDYRTLRPEIGLEVQPQLSYYGLGGEPDIPDTEMASVFTRLADTPLASLYASFSWAEDFAEYVTFSYLVRTLGADYSIRVVDHGETVAELHPMDSPLVAERVRFLDERLFARPD